ncbi:Tat pathway signal sequence domain protein [Crossiella sp. CA-258035]|uniref:Tat pathway signal sequence domain protein n=1 Tax=Crossiella sp. CA-258035 TaxID=2981138 RepID=UPI0024BC3D5F|nr:Tat pathway signal sequence domain protein [Crossiella sp. CA-258035]WHT20145.1 Tat pathway signal sequence domain protein [Crossiella sp. CA-258035]
MTDAREFSRRTALSLLGGAAAALALPGASALAAPLAWQQRWAPVPSRDGLGAFEGVEDDRANSHPGAKHIYPQGDTYRFDMHKRDRDTSTDRQRNEVRGMRSGGASVDLFQGQTWRFTYSMYIPSSLKATTSFTHIMQTKMPGLGSAPVTVMSLRRRGSRSTIEFKVTEGDVLVGDVDLAPLQNKWIDTEVEIKVGNGNGSVRWVVREGGRTVIDARKSNVDTWLDDRLRPKWGIYRSLNDSANINDTYLLLRNLKAYQQV